MSDKAEHIKKLDKLINKFILESRKFIEYTAFPNGTVDLLINGEKNDKFVWDYEYFVFTKSTKLLIAIRELLKKNFNEDVFILIRSMFENYMSCRYLNSNEDKLDEFIENPLKVALAYYNVNPKGEIIDRDNNVIGTVENPSRFNEKFRLNTEKDVK